jgi:hypothetical protein
MDERATIVDGHDNRAAIMLVRHSYFGSERQHPMGRGQSAGVQWLTTRGLAAALDGINRCYSRLGTKRGHRTKQYEADGSRVMKSRRFIGHPVTGVAWEPGQYRKLLLLCRQPNQRGKRALRVRCDSEPPVLRSRVRSLGQSCYAHDVRETARLTPCRHGWPIGGAFPRSSLSRQAAKVCGSRCWKSRFHLRLRIDHPAGKMLSERPSPVPGK